jgi:hypothetical protein
MIALEEFVFSDVYVLTRPWIFFVYLMFISLRILLVDRSV